MDIGVKAVGRGVLALVVATLFASEAGAQTTSALSGMSLEQLMSVPVDVTTRIPESRLLTSPSVFVLTAEEIRQSGASTLAGVLRLVPGMHVAQIDGTRWAIGIRGFSDRLARAMLVLIDGRAVYSPLFAGTYWEVQDLPLQDIERIEVVRGPGGTLWGANAVTGIVNIVRKTAAASQGTVMTLSSGTEDPYGLSVSHGGGSNVQYRVSGKLAGRSPQLTPTGLRYDRARFMQGGARLEWKPGAGAFLAQADVYRAEIGQRDVLVTYDPPSTETRTTDDPLSGGNLLLRWVRNRDNPRSLHVQAYYDRSSRSELVFNESQDVFDLDVQQGVAAGRHGLLWGAGVRRIAGRTTTRGTLRFTPPDRTDHLFSAFVQDDITLLRDRLRLVVGTKIEHNDYSGVEVQPSARLQWSPATTLAASLSVTRAVRTPSRVEHDFESGNLLTPAPIFVRLQPNPRFESEELLAYEAGLVAMPWRNLFTSIALFRNQHDRVFSTELMPTFVENAGLPSQRLIIPVTFGNGLRGHSYGIEVANDLRVSPWWRVTGHYSWFRAHLHKRPGSTDITQENRAERGYPRHQFQLTTTMRLPGRLTVDAFFRSLSAIPDVGVQKYATTNARLEWALDERTALFIVGRNLHRPRHAEFTDSSNGIVAIQRSVLFGAVWTR